MCCNESKIPLIPLTNPVGNLNCVFSFDIQNQQVKRQPVLQKALFFTALSVGSGRVIACRRLKCCVWCCSYGSALPLWMPKARCLSASETGRKLLDFSEVPNALHFSCVQCSEHLFACRFRYLTFFFLGMKGSIRKGGGT